MSFNNIAARSIVSLVPQLGSNPTVCEFGNQTINLDDNAICPAGFRRATAMNSQSAELYYKALGFSRYVALDVNEKFGSHIVDLNRPAIPQLPDGELASYSLVTNNGTGEHLFNQHAVFQNCHDLCQEGGVMLHILPCTNWLNHGFYSFQPLLFVDLAAVNGYQMLHLSVANRWGFEVALPIADTAACVEQIKPRVKGGPLHSAIKSVQDDERNRSKASFPNVLVVAAMRKVGSRDFRMPVQGKYVGDIESSELAAEYATV